MLIEAKSFYSNEPVSEMVFCLFELQVQAHISHLQTTSFSEHKALEDLYNGLPELLDRFVETYQGQNGKIVEYAKTLEIKNNCSMIPCLKEEMLNMKKYRTSFKDGSLLQIIDDIVELLSSTLYKLQFLK
jgi:hypothetical protein